jgi:FlaA1/EpsC-like NDP-sugar epimerase
VNAPSLESKNIGKSILVTGAGGYIGSALTEALALTHPRFLILLDHSEQNLYEISMRLAAAGMANYAAILGDILDERLLTEIFERYHPEAIYHAAAFKHVPLMESNPIAVVGNNAIGSWELAKTATRFDAERLLMISTDKAVNPRSIMGASKRIAELALIGMGGSKTKMNVVRLGNVLGSHGSVGPLFQRQVEDGGPVTVTHPEAQRYFLTLKETVDLILAATALDESGSIFVPRMNEPVKILAFAKRMIHEGSQQTSPDIEIVFTGLRPGDKLEEDFVSETEILTQTSDERLHRVKALPMDSEALEASLSRISESIRERNLAALLAEVSRLIPEYKPSEMLLGHLDPSLRRT